MFSPSSHLLSATSGHLFPPATSTHLFPPATSGSRHVTRDYNDCSTLQALSMIKPTAVLHISNFFPSHGPSIRCYSPPRDDMLNMNFQALPLADPYIPSGTYLRLFDQLFLLLCFVRSDAYEPMQFTYVLLCMLNFHQTYGDSSFQDCKKAPSLGFESPSRLLNGESLKVESIADFDLFFKRLYSYYCEKCLCCIIIKWIVELMSLAFTICFLALSIGNICNGSLYPSWRALSCLSASCAHSSTYTSRVDVRTGCDLDGLKLVVEGASIPECANGTSIVIPIPGAVSDEDMAVTGAGARVHDQDITKLPFLSDFEELEGELDFVTRVVVLTFYPAVPARTPITLGEVPYIDNFTSHHLTLFFPRDLFASNMRLWEHINKIKQDTHTVTITNPLPSSDANNNPFSTDDNSLKSKNSSTSWVNLLSGDGIISISQPMRQTTLHDPFLNPFHDHDEASEPPPRKKSELGRPSSASRLITSDSSDLGVIMEPSLAELYHNLRKELAELFQYKFFDTSVYGSGFPRAADERPSPLVCIA
ncbi:unnamed protein product [Lactuca saligna]|uniref:Autophagy-related protein 9 n=1 Tax=Lactuca saligna TaxID=75948 RepID=A0AA36EPL6_LACSI|nr:unnamed protein product [Lactuca saligna]